MINRVEKWVVQQNESGLNVQAGKKKFLWPSDRLRIMCHKYWVSRFASNHFWTFLSLEDKPKSNLIQLESYAITVVAVDDNKNQPKDLRTLTEVDCFCQKIFFWYSNFTSLF